jgi:hypothetical protein
LLTAIPITVEVKKYTESHEWVELSDNGIGKSPTLPVRIAFFRKKSSFICGKWVTDWTKT